jgi:phosphoribosylanthranilate isomerase
MTLVKICGVRDAETATAAAKAGADFVGMIFAESKRRVSPQECHDVAEAVRAARRAPPPAQFEAPTAGEVRGLNWFGAWSEAIETALWRWRPLLVGVFAGQSADEVNDIAEAAGLDLVQLSGGEPAEFVRKVHLPAIRALHVAPDMTGDDLLDAIAGLPAASIMLDTASESAKGGTGQTFDWTVAAEIRPRLPFFLAGGLRPDTVAEAVGRVDPWAVDVASGVETNGKKDAEKIRAFVRAAKQR